MKFWQLVSIFRSEEENVLNILSNRKWTHYRNLFSKYKELVANGDRKALDTVVDSELVAEIARLSTKILYYSTFKKQLYSYNNRYVDKVVPIAEAIKMFNGENIEEALEKTECDIT